MASAWCALRGSASKFASVCGGRVRVITTVVNRPSLALNPTQLRPFVSGSFYSPTVIDQLSSEQKLVREIDSRINFASQITDVVNGRKVTLGSIPFRIEDDGGKTVTLTRDYKGEHIKVLVGIPREHRKDELSYGTGVLGDKELRIHLTVNVTKKSGLSLEFRLEVVRDYIYIYDVFVDHSGDSLKDQLRNIEGSYDFKDVGGPMPRNKWVRTYIKKDTTNNILELMTPTSPLVSYTLIMAFYKYLVSRVTYGTRTYLYNYMTTNKRRHLFWLKDVKKFLDDES